MTNTELRQHIRESIFEILTEKLCKKGKAYVARRKAAGEKHSAYLMGRAVKVCKGMIGKKKNENKSLNEKLGCNPEVTGICCCPPLWIQCCNLPEIDTAMTDVIEGDDCVNCYENPEDKRSCNACKRAVKKVDPNMVFGKAAPYGSRYDSIEEQVYYIDSIDEIQMIEDALNEEAELGEGRKKKKCKPSKGKRFAKRVNGKCRSFGQKGKASDGGDRIRPGTKKAHAYCARSAKIKKCKNPPCANTLSRRKWKCQGSRSVPE